MKKIIVPTVFLSTFLVACGGGSSSSGGDSNGGGNSGGGSTTTSDPNITKVSGLYKTSRANDEAYLYIDESGNVTSYDYQGDGVGTGSNCYKTAINADQINSGLSGGKVTYVDGRYTISGSTNTLEFTYSDVSGMQNFKLDNVISSSTGLDFSSANMNIVIGGDGKNKTTDVSVQDIKSNICS